MVKILVVEDERAMNALICAHLRKAGYEAKACYDGEEGLTALAESSYDLILTDIMMPKTDGFSLAVQVRTADKNIPIIFMTARDDKPSQLYAYQLGVDDYITKPFDLDLLVMKISALLRRLKFKRRNS